MRQLFEEVFKSASRKEVKARSKCLVLNLSSFKSKAEHDRERKTFITDTRHHQNVCFFSRKWSFRHPEGTTHSSSSRFWSLWSFVGGGGGVRWMMMMGFFFFPVCCSVSRLFIAFRRRRRRRRLRAGSRKLYPFGSRFYLSVVVARSMMQQCDTLFGRRL